MSVVLLGVLLLAAGISLAFFGLRAFVILLPAFCMLTGFFLGASIVASWLGEGLMSDIAEWIAGYILGMLFALVSFTYWYAGAILASASLGAMMAMGVMGILGVDSEAIIWVAAILGGVGMAALTFLARHPNTLLIATTATAGAIMVVTSISLIFRRVQLREIRWGGQWYDINVPWSSWLVLIVIAAGGFIVQWQTFHNLPLPGDRWMRADAAARRAAGLDAGKDIRTWR
jgi:hypothetical protein